MSPYTDDENTMADHLTEKDLESRGLRVGRGSRLSTSRWSGLTTTAIVSLAVVGLLGHGYISRPQVTVTTNEIASPSGCSLNSRPIFPQASWNLVAYTNDQCTDTAFIDTGPGVKNCTKGPTGNNWPKFDYSGSIGQFKVCFYPANSCTGLIGSTAANTACANTSTIPGKTAQYYTIVDYKTNDCAP